MRSFLIYFSLFSLVLFGAFSVASKTIPEERIILTEKNMVQLKGEINEITAGKVIGDILNIRKTNADGKIYLVIDSPGGEVDAGLQLIDFLDTQSNIIPIAIKAASMASAILESMQERLIIAGSTLMFHRAAGQFSGYFSDGEVESHLAYAKKMILKMEKQNAKRLQLTLEEYRKQVTAELWMYGEEAIEKHAADRIVKPVCDANLMSKTIQEDRQGLFGSAIIVWSACPLITLPLSVTQGH